MLYREEIILDMLSLERNHILVRSYLIGGPSERTLPPRSIDEVSCLNLYLYIIMFYFTCFQSIDYGLCYKEIHA